MFSRTQKFEIESGNFWNARIYHPDFIPCLFKICSIFPLWFTFGKVYVFRKHLFLPEDQTYILVHKNLLSFVLIWHYLQCLLYKIMILVYVCVWLFQSIIASLFSSHSSFLPNQFMVSFLKELILFFIITF